jgi:hypothetical protein
MDISLEQRLEAVEAAIAELKQQTHPPDCLTQMPQEQTETRKE